MSRSTKLTEKFLRDDRFVSFILTGDRDMGEYWKRYLELHPSEKEAFKEAERLVRIIRETRPADDSNIIDEIAVSGLYRLRDSVRNQQGVPSASPGNSRRWYGRSLLLRAAAAAVITAAVLFAIYNRTPSQIAAPTTPGSVTVDESGEVRILLASGASLLPGEMAENEKVSESGNSFIKSGGNRLFYLAGTGEGGAGNGEKGITEEEQFNTIIVPRGKRITLMLPDSTAVWINSGTELKFPVRFTAESRTVSLKGEAFFDVAHESHRPFRVKTEALNVEVYGTSFNVSAYGDDESVMTTLVKGKVGIETGEGEKIVLEPDQMADYTINDGSLTVQSVDVNLYTSWTTGSIIFRDETLESLRPKIERWYNTEIIYRDNAIGDIRLSGIINEDKELDHVMKLIEKACQLSYTIRENRVLLSRNPEQLETGQINNLNTNNNNRL
jgi:ferric-dicitrate binding protein FerR (iron transport regulator)